MVVGDLEATTGYISEIEGGSMFATSYRLTFNFHSKLEMMSITCLRSFGQNEQELKFITIPQKLWPFIDHDDLLSFKNGCDVVLEKKPKASNINSMIEMWMVYRCLKKFINGIVKVQNHELTNNRNDNSPVPLPSVIHF